MNKMTMEQEAHLKRIKGKFTTLVDSKYRMGQEEHGGDLKDLTAVALLDAAIDETLDQFVYLTTLREKIVGE